jgi:hypothetical protein
LNAANDPRWVCLEGMNADELAAHDYGCALSMDAVKRVLDGRDVGHGSCNEPWASVRQQLLSAVAVLRSLGYTYRADGHWRRDETAGAADFEHWWWANRVKTVLNPGGFARMVWRDAQRCALAQQQQEAR